MSIEKMKFVTVSSTSDDFELMMLQGVQSELFHPEKASSIVNSVNEGRVLSISDELVDAYHSLSTIATRFGISLPPEEYTGPSFRKSDIFAFISEVEERIKVLGDSNDLGILSSDDEIALEKLRELDFKAIHECQYITFSLGRLPIQNINKLELLDNETFDYVVLHQNAHYQWIVYVTSNSFAKEVKKIWDTLYFEKIIIPAVDRKKIVCQFSDTLGNMLGFTKNRVDIVDYYQYIAIIDDKYTLNGFVRERDIEAFKQQFDSLSVTFTLNESDLKPPTSLKNNWFFKPFELFVEMYSLPSYNEIDPTVFLGITYSFLFGLMFGDVGQGLLLALIGFIGEKKTGNRLLGIIGRIGLSSIFFGFLFGSVFGFEEVLNPIHQSLFHVPHKLFEVMDGSSTMTLLIAAVIIGAILMITTMLMRMVIMFKQKKMAEVLFSHNGLAGLVFYSYLLAGMACSMIGAPSIFKQPYLIFFVYVPIACFFMKEPLTSYLAHEKMTPHQGWGNFFLETFFEVFEILLSFVANSLSYLRVGGFILSHAGMMLVVMTLNAMVGKAGFLVIVLGNLFVVCLEGLIVGIQTLRLQYYEMFSRYYVGGGRKFVSLSQDN